MNPNLPHAPYIRAVVDALTEAGLEPTGWWAEDGELDRYRDDDLAGMATMLNAVLEWDDEHSAVNTTQFRHGVALVWEHPADSWLWAPLKDNGHLVHEPKFVPRLGRYSDPAAVAASVRALLAHHALPEGHAPYWHPADSVRAAITAWDAETNREN